MCWLELNADELLVVADPGAPEPDPAEWVRIPTEALRVIGAAEDRHGH